MFVFTSEQKEIWLSMEAAYDKDDYKEFDRLFGELKHSIENDKELLQEMIDF